VTVHVRVFESVEELSRGAAESAARLLSDAVRARGSASLALAGGATPEPAYRALAGDAGKEIDWARVHVFWGDERFVPHDDARSNYRMAREMLLDHVPCPAANVHPMPTHHANPESAAREYEAALRDFFGEGPPRFDLIHLGVGSDGHVASLFPGSPAVRETTRWVVPSDAPDGSPRLTLTLPVLTEAARIHFIVTGAGKARAVHAVLAGSADGKDLPAAQVQAAGAHVTWWLDRDAAAQHVRARDVAAAPQEE
jgi:6-phosphogluconolactonase